MILLATSMFLFSATAFADPAMTLAQITARLQTWGLTLRLTGEARVVCHDLFIGKDGTLSWRSSESETYTLNTSACEKDQSTGLIPITFNGKALACSYPAPVSAQ